MANTSSSGSPLTFLLWAFIGWGVGTMLFPNKPTLADYQEFLDAYEAGEVDEDDNPIEDEYHT